MVFVALGVAAPALKGRRWLEDMPQWSSAGLTARREVIESEDELVALVADVGGAVTERRWLHCDLLVPLALTFIGIKDLEREREERAYSFTEDLLMQMVYERREKGEKDRKREGRCTVPGIS